MKGNVIGFVTALLTALVVLWQGYQDYVKAHPAPTAHTVNKPVEPTTPIYWHDGQHWYCRVGDQQYIWLSNQERTAWQQPQMQVRR